MHIPLLVIFTGLPCTGKTTLARRVAAEVGLPLLAKDDIKERLFASLGWSDREWSQKLGRATFDLMFYFIELELGAGRSLITEAPFFPQFHNETLRQIRQRHPCRMLVIECVADGAVLYQRFVRRSESGERHAGHVDHTSYAEAEALFRRGKREPLDIGGGYIEVDTSDFTRVDLEPILSAIQGELEKGDEENG